jgi:hypothetical protein
MGLLRCPASFQRLMEGILRNISNVIVYIDDLLVHTQTHDKHQKVLDQVLDRLQMHNLKINLDKCFFGNKELSYSLSLRKVSSQEKTNLRPPKMQNHTRMLKQYARLSDSAIFSKLISRILQSSLLHCFGLHEKTQDIKVTLCLKKLWTLSAFSKIL